MEKNIVEKNIVVAQIGRQIYRDTKYKKFRETAPAVPYAYLPADEECKECKEYRYSFHVILDELKRSKTCIETKEYWLILVGTADSLWADLCHYFSEQFKKEMPHTLKSSMKKEKKDGKETEEFTDIQKILEPVEQFLSECLEGTIVKLLIQSSGITRTESMDNFNTLISRLSETINFGKTDSNLPAQEIKLHLDISNGFRSLPFYVFLAANYMAQIQPKENSIRIFLYYGMFDNKLEKLKDGHYVSSRSGTYAPYVDMSDAADIVQWTDAISEFYNSGSVIQILKILNSREEWRGIQIDEKKTTVEEAFRKFSYAINTNNLSLLHEATSMLSQMKNNLDSGNSNFPQYVKTLLDYISDDFRKRFVDSRKGRPKYGMLSIKIAEWYLDQQRIGDAVIALQEGMVTYVMEKFPEKCEKLINKKAKEGKEIATGKLPEDEALFDFVYREIVQKYIFDIRDAEERSWINEYVYICEHLRNPFIRMQYSTAPAIRPKGAARKTSIGMQHSADGETSAETGTADSQITVNTVSEIGRTSAETDMEEAVEMIRGLIQKMSEEELDGPVEQWMNDVLEMDEFDVFISHRHTFQTEDDGAEAAKKIRDFLKKQTYKDRNGEDKPFNVFLDQTNLGDGFIGDFATEIKWAIRNSRYVVLIIGKDSFVRKNSKDSCQTDHYYREILTATEENYKKKILVVQTEGFKKPKSDEEMEELLKDLNELDFSERLKNEVKNIINRYQHIGDDRIWNFSESDTKALCQSLLESIRKNMSETENRDII